MGNSRVHQVKELPRTLDTKDAVYYGLAWKQHTGILLKELTYNPPPTLQRARHTSRVDFPAVVLNRRRRNYGL